MRRFPFSSVMLLVLVSFVFLGLNANCRHSDIPLSINDIYDAPWIPEAQVIMNAIETNQYSTILYGWPCNMIEIKEGVYFDFDPLRSALNLSSLLVINAVLYGILYLSRKPLNS